MKFISMMDRLETAVVNVAKKINHNKPSKKWTEYHEQNLWYGLVACNLSSRITFEQAKATLEYLKSSGKLKIIRSNNFFNGFENKLLEALKKPIHYKTSRNNLIRKYPFPYQKANHISRTARNIYSNSSIKEILASSTEPRKIRNIIISKSVGIGPKQASLFLRNIGCCKELAILDVHILKYMFTVGILNSLKKAIPNINQYEKLEIRLKEYSHKLSLNMSSLDIAIWIVMRVYQREFAV